MVLAAATHEVAGCERIGVIGLHAYGEDCCEAVCSIRQRERDPPYPRQMIGKV